MKKTIALLLFPLYFILSTSCVAQDLKVTSAVGQVCRGGLSTPNGKKPNYYNSTRFAIYLSPVNKNIVFDSLYIDGSIALKLEPNQTYPRVDSVNKQYVLCLNYNYNLPHTTGSAVNPLRHFTGSGLVIYSCNGKSYAAPILSMNWRRPANVK